MPIENTDFIDAFFNMTLNIYKAYASFQNKQIFTGIDKVSSNEDKLLKTIVNEHRVLHLSSNGNKLFGKSWAKEVVEKKEKINGQL